MPTAGRHDAMMQVSIVIPAWNRKQPVQRAIDSCVAVRGLQVEVIIVDDGSTDGILPNTASIG